MGAVEIAHPFDVEFEIGNMHIFGTTPYGQRALATILTSCGTRGRESRPRSGGKR